MNLRLLALPVGLVLVGAVDCASAGAGYASNVISPSDTGFVVTGDAASPRGASWTFVGTVDGVRYDLAGVLYKPIGAGPFPAVILSHGYEGTGANLAGFLAPAMVQWGLVCIAPNYTHATGVPIGAPGGSRDVGASDANLLRAHVTYELLRRLGYVDMSRVALHGHSMGAWVTAVMASRYPGDFRVASATGGGIRPIRARPGPAPSAFDVEHIKIPFSLHHGRSDETLPLQYDLELDAVLKEHDVPHELYVYPGGHLAPRNSPLMLERVHAWYARYGMFDGAEHAGAPPR